MLYKLLADIVVLLHFLWIVFLFLGALWGVKNRVLKIFHLAGLGFAIFIQVVGWYCPLTYLEVWLRARHDPFLVYAGSFIIHYVEELVYLQMSRSLIFVLSLMLVAFNAWFYLGKRN